MTGVDAAAVERLLARVLHDHGDGGIWEHFDRRTAEEVAEVLAAALAPLLTQSPSICGVVSGSGPNHEPLACGYLAGHSGSHSWATLPSFPGFAVMLSRTPDTCPACDSDNRSLRLLPYETPTTPCRDSWHETTAPLLQAQHDSEDVRAAVSEELLSLTAFRELGATIHRFRCTSPDCRHCDDDGYFTPRDNDAASAAHYWLRAALSSPAPAERDAP